MRTAIDKEMKIPLKTPELVENYGYRVSLVIILNTWLIKNKRTSFSTKLRYLQTKLQSIGCFRLLSRTKEHAYARTYAHVNELVPHETCAPQNLCPKKFVPHEIGVHDRRALYQLANKKRAR